MLPRAFFAHKLAHIDSNRTDGVAERIAYARFQRGNAKPRLLGRRKLFLGTPPQRNNALAWCHGVACRRTDSFAETAFGASVRRILNLRKGLQVRKVDGRIIVDNNPRIENADRIQCRLDALHEGKCLLPPLAHDEGCHVASCAMLALERAIEFVDDGCDQILDHCAKTRKPVLVRQIEREAGVQVSVARVSEDDSLLLVTVPVEDGAKSRRAFRKPSQRKDQVFLHEECSRRTTFA